MAIDNCSRVVLSNLTKSNSCTTKLTAFSKVQTKQFPSHTYPAGAYILKYHMPVFFNPQVTNMEYYLGKAPVRPQRAHQNISVPFLWEDKPGMPKKDYHLCNPSTTNPFVHGCQDDLLFKSYLQSFEFDMISNDTKETFIGSEWSSETDDESSNDIIDVVVPHTKFFFPLATQGVVQLFRTACFLQNGNGNERKV